MDGEQCIFCSIISGAVASKRVYEDDKVSAILDINPANPAHILLLPKQHFGILPQMPDDIVAHMGMVAKHLSLAILRSGFGFQGTNIFLANGEAAGQRAQHVMLHVVPRGDGDKLTNFDFPRKPLDTKTLEEARDGLANAVKEQLGFDVPKIAFEPEPAEQKVMSTPVVMPSTKAAVPSSAIPPPKLDLDDLTDFLTGGKHA